jgi:hypothetical protein
MSGNIWQVNLWLEAHVRPCMRAVPFTVQTLATGSYVAMILYLKLIGVIFLTAKSIHEAKTRCNYMYTFSSASHNIKPLIRNVNNTFNLC